MARWKQRNELVSMKKEMGWARTREKWRRDQAARRQTLAEKGSQKPLLINQGLSEIQTHDNVTELSVITADFVKGKEKSCSNMVFL